MATKKKKAGRPPSEEGPAKMVTIKLRADELEELRDLSAALKVTQADIMRMGIAAARKRARS